MKKDPHQEREASRYEYPIASRELILALMSEIGEPASFSQILTTLSIQGEAETSALQLRLRAMVRDGQLVLNKGKADTLYAVASKVALIAGRVTAHADGFGFLICDEKRDDIFLSRRQMKVVFHGDRVLVRVRGKDQRGRDEGEIVEVLERKTTQIVGRVYFDNRKVAWLEALNRRIGHAILIVGERIEVTLGQIAVANIIEQPSLHGIPRAEVMSILGEHLTPALEVEVAIRNNDIPFEFSHRVQTELEALPEHVTEQQKSQRADLRHLDFVTIDGEDAKDFDDAVYCEPRPSGGWQLFVAIADVAHYVQPGGQLDDAAYSRGTSVYFPQYVVPMLPEKLSNGLCSLNPDLDRLVMVCEMTLSPQGRISHYQFYEGLIHSKERLTYTQVAEWIQQKQFPRHEKSLSNLLRLHDLLIARRKERGAVDFATTEITFDFSADGRIDKIKPLIRNIAHTIIEECMLCANVSAAKLITKYKLPGLYRVHEKPKPEKVNHLRGFLSGFNIELGGKEFPKPQDYQAAAKQLGRLPNGHILQIALLRSMQQAVYQPENKGHFGLAYTQYAHFTSPIRRYPDLLIHRLIKSIIHSNQPCKEVRRWGKAKKAQHVPLSTSSLTAHGEHLSFTERRADDAVYEVLEWVKCDYISEHVGDDFPGVISGVTRFGIFVQLPELFVEGLVHVSSLRGDYYHYNQEGQTLIGERTHQTFGMGEQVKVKVARVDVDERKIDFELLSHSPIKGSQSRKTKSRKTKSRKTKSTTRAKRAPSDKKQSDKKPSNKKQPNKKQSGKSHRRRKSAHQSG